MSLLESLVTFPMLFCSTSHTLIVPDLAAYEVVWVVSSDL